MAIPDQPASPDVSMDEVPEESDAISEQVAEASDEDGEDLFGDDWQNDYRGIDQLDRYDPRGLDENFQEEMDEAAILAARRAAEDELEFREAQELRRQVRRGKVRLPGALMDLDDEGPRRRRRIDAAQAGALGEEDEELVPLDIELENYRGSVKEWVSQEPVQAQIERYFVMFLRTFQDDHGERRYVSLVTSMCAANRQSLEVSFADLTAFRASEERNQGKTLAFFTAECPRTTLPVLSKAAMRVVLELFPEYHQVHREVFVRISGLPFTESIRAIRQVHLNQLVQTTGVVVRRTGVFPQLQEVKFVCAKCRYTLGPFYQNTETEVKPQQCPNCESRGPFSLDTENTIYRSYQKITLQESPGTVPAGRLPRAKEVILLHDLIDCARPGEEIEVSGCYTNSFDASLNVQHGFPVFGTVIEANFVNKREDRFAAYKLTDEDREEIMQLGADPRVGLRIARSIAPSIFGHENIKMALALALFGGEEKHDGKHRIRGDINVLLLGDPGVAKSQFLKYTEKTAQRAVFTTGKGASAVGLTAAVHKDPVTREWVLEGGALVLADRGVCMIDEFDKMNDQDRVSIHEAMEQQSISVSKAGIVTSLQARCSVIAAANPRGGRYDSSRTFLENVDLTDPILSRFDVLCVVKDTVDCVADRQLARFVVGSHVRSHPKHASDAAYGLAEPAAVEGTIPQETLRKYITYAKQACRPKLQPADYERLARVYAEVRRESATTQGMPVAVRHLESMIRVSEAHAKMHLRNEVRSEDVDVAIRVLLESFMSTQKYTIQQVLRRKFRRFLSRHRDFQELLMGLLRGLVRRNQRYAELQGAAADAGTTVRLADIEDEARKYNLLAALPEFFASEAFANAGFTVGNDAVLLAAEG
ncbi:unnamed protein product [Pedinophyceae sp. YPF-701]|nr:unnamed protein product [Pedinophyceae sp. YPF-701]